MDVEKMRPKSYSMATNFIGTGELGEDEIGTKIHSTGTRLAA
jgi:hypothetical protein